MPKSANKRHPAKTQPRQQQQLSSPLSAPVLPSPATTVNNGPEPPAPAVATVDFGFFILRASRSDIKAFFELAAMTQEGRNLKSLWHRAFTEGVKQGTDETESTFSERLRDTDVKAFQEGYEAGYDSAEERVQHYGDQIAVALQDERSKWKGHGETCFKLPISPSTREFAVQSDPICLPPATSSPTCEVAIQSDPIHFPSTVSSSTQTPSTPPTPTNSTATLPSLLPLPPPQLVDKSTDPALPNAPAKLSWADDIPASLPSFIPPIAPRDLSCLRSEKAHPFGALRQRDRRTNRQPRKHRNRNMFPLSNIKSHSAPGRILNHLYPTPPISSSHIPRKPHIPHLHSSPSLLSSSHLDWESDPRLFALSAALKALGWNRGVP